MTIAYYISAHGYGHGVRSCDILRALQRIQPELRVFVISDLPREFLENRLAPRKFRFRQAAFDVGMVQLDSIRVDIPATLDKVMNLCHSRTRLIREETEFLINNDIRIAVADIPSIPLEAAARAHIPGVAVGNFSWDWIYSEFRNLDSRWQEASCVFAEGYASSRLLLRLPFHAAMDAFPHIEDVPLLATPGRTRRGDLAALTGALPGIPWILLSFTTLDWDEAALDRIEQLSGYEFFTVLPLAWKRRNLHAVDRSIIRFSDVLASCDAVISKPGYGIVSECAVNRKPLIYAERTGFAEYPILESAVHRYLRHIHIPAERLYRGDLRQALDAIWQAPEPQEILATGGDTLAANRLIRIMTS